MKSSSYIFTPLLPTSNSANSIWDAEILVFYILSLIIWKYLLLLLGKRRITGNIFWLVKIGCWVTDYMLVKLSCLENEVLNWESQSCHF